MLLMLLVSLGQPSLASVILEQGMIMPLVHEGSSLVRHDGARLVLVITKDSGRCPPMSLDAMLGCPLFGKTNTASDKPPVVHFYCDCTPFGASLGFAAHFIL